MLDSAHPGRGIVRCSGGTARLRVCGREGILTVEIATRRCLAKPNLARLGSGPERKWLGEECARDQHEAGEREGPEAGEPDERAARRPVDAVERAIDRGKADDCAEA